MHILPTVAPALQFSTDGRRLISVHAKHVEVHERHGCAVAASCAATAFGDQLWLVRDGALERRLHDGRALGEPSLLAGRATPAGMAAQLTATSSPRAPVEASYVRAASSLPHPLSPVRTATP